MGASRRLGLMLTLAAAARATWDLESSRAAKPAKSAQCGAVDTLFVAHWTHVPKAGGTALASLARRVACAKNPGLATRNGSAFNPCCIPDFCATEKTCDASPATCPLVVGIGRHETSMSKLVDLPCCGHEWYQATVESFMHYALTAPETRPDHYAYVPETKRNLELMGVTKDASGRWVASPSKRVKAWKLRRVRGYAQWPLEQRVRFFAETGVDRKLIARRLETGRIDAYLRERDPDLLKRVRGIVDAMPASTRLDRAREAGECHRAAHGSWPKDAAAFSPYTDGFSPAVAAAARPCCAGRAPGSSSLTMLREPFVRAASAFFYGGHNPNQDHYYKLRGGVFDESRASGGRPQTVRRTFSFRDFAGFDEYRNVATKMFGDATCEDMAPCVRLAARRLPPGSVREGGCSLLRNCHAYRNASAYLGDRHLASAKAALDRHAFVGLTEAYAASVRLAWATFGLEETDEDFLQARKGNHAQPCAPGRRLRLDAKACRGYFAQNVYDYELYEHAHREFCVRLRAANLIDRPDVRRELDKGSLCGIVDFSHVDDVCGRLETPEVLRELASLRAQCRDGFATGY